MGYNTTVLILNDAFDQIEKHPEDFVQGINIQMHEGGDIAVGNHGNAATVMKTAHADVSRLYFSGGNWLSDLTPYFVESEVRDSRNPKIAEYLRDRCLEAKSMLIDSVKQLDEIIAKQNEEG